MNVYQEKAREICSNDHEFLAMIRTECQLCPPIARALQEAAMEAHKTDISLIHLVKNEIYDGENEMTKRLCVALENEILKEMNT